MRTLREHGQAPSRQGRTFAVAACQLCTVTSTAPPSGRTPGLMCSGHTGGGQRPGWWLRAKGIRKAGGKLGGHRWSRSETPPVTLEQKRRAVRVGCALLFRVE